MLRSILGYVSEFKEAFRNREITINEVTLAIADSEETLVTPNSRCDKWLDL